jgi:glycosyltransferase involved in cell wall biosynthesis
MAGIPAWNAEGTIGGIIRRVRQYVDMVIVVDDGSSDNTAQVSSQAGALVVRHKRNLGYGAAIKSIFRKARQIKPDILVILDSDGQHNPDEIPAVIKPVISKTAEISIGSRFVYNRINDNTVPIYRMIGIKMLNLVIRILGPNVQDSQSGFRAYSRNAIALIDPSQSGMSAGSEILIQAFGKNLDMIEVPITCTYDENSSTQNPVLHGINVLASLFRLSLAEHT